MGTTGPHQFLTNTSTPLQCTVVDLSTRPAFLIICEPPKNPPKKILPKNFSHKIPPKKFLQKNPPKKFQKNSPKIQKNSKQFLKKLLRF